MKSFTLIEFLIVFGMVSILSSISFLAIKSGQKSLFLLRAANNLAFEIKKAREMAIAVRKINGEFPKSYGIYIKKTGPNIFLFGDIKAPFNRYNPQDKIIEDLCQIEIGKELCSGKIQFDFLGSDFNIVFQPPEPKTIINANETISEAEIKLKINSLEKIIKVNKSGLIFVQ